MHKLGEAVVQDYMVKSALFQSASLSFKTWEKKTSIDRGKIYEKKYFCVQKNCSWKICFDSEINLGWVNIYTIGS